ncbi:MAG: S41 family peptidase [Desulfarculales bacterium]|nr:S41 family peptidase [Desulfarculales bacterium]
MGHLKSWKFILPLLMLTAFLAGAMSSQITLPPARAASDADYEKMRLFTEVLAEVQSKYVEEKSLDDLIDEALKGMLNGLDPHSAYLTQAEFKELQDDTKGSFSGVGIEITPKDGALTVVSPIEGTPADLAGVKAGDQIMKIDGQLTKNMTLTEAIKAIRGERGTSVTLSLMREGESQLLDIAIVRDVIPIHSVRFNLLEEGYGYVRIISFQENTTRDLIKALETLQDQPAPLKGLVLDLRNDPGGLLQEAVRVADQFLNEGIIVSTVGRSPGQKMVFRASSTQTAAGNYPIVCLVNNGSASASEIVAGALQDHKRAIIMGTTTFGKGSVQTILPLSDKGALKLTTARFYTPSGRSIQAEGIKPDMIVPLELPSEQLDPAGEIREKDIRGAMPSQSAKPSENSGSAGKLQYPLEKLALDNQLQRALDQLKVWSTYFDSYLPALAPASTDAL